MIELPGKEKGTLLMKRWDQLKEARMPWEPLWRSVGEHVHPHRGDFNSTTPLRGSPKTAKIFDTTAPWALGQFASGLAGFLTSSTERWFEIDYDIPKHLMDDDPELRMHAEDATNVLYTDVFNSSLTNFNQMIHELYTDVGAWGTSIMMLEDQPGQNLRFTTYHLNNCWISEDDGGRVDTVYRRVMKTGRQLINKYSDVLSDEDKRKMGEKPFEEHECLHATEPRDVFNSHSALSIHKPWASYLVLAKSKQVLEEGGYDGFPYVVPRWSKSSEEIYGRSPSIFVLPDIQMINKMMKTIIRAAEKVTDPSLQVPDDGFIMPIKTAPSSINYYRAGTQDRIVPLETRSRIDISFELLKDRRDHIARGYHVDAFKFPEDGVERTRAEALIIQEGKMRSVAPMVGRMYVELLQPLIVRAYHSAVKRGMIRPPPKNAPGPLAIRFKSSIARAQKATQLQNALRWMESIVPMAEFKPEVLNRLNADEFVTWSHDLLDAPERILNSDEVTAQLTKQQQEAAAKQAQTEGLNQDSGTALNAAKATELLSRGGR